MSSHVDHVDLVILIYKGSQLQFLDLYFGLSVLLFLSTNVQILKIVVLVQDSNLITGKLHGFLMLYACLKHLHFCQLLSEIDLHPNFMSLPCFTIIYLDLVY